MKILFLYGFLVFVFIFGHPIQGSKCEEVYLHYEVPFYIPSLGILELKNLKSDLGIDSDLNASILPHSFVLTEELKRRILSMRIFIERKGGTITYRRNDPKSNFMLDLRFDKLDDEDMEHEVRNFAFANLLNIGFWMEENLNKALMEHEAPVFFSSFMIRYRTPTDDIQEKSPDRHRDGTDVYFNSTLTLLGDSGTIYWSHLSNKDSLGSQAPIGKILVFSGLGRELLHNEIKATFHGAPTFNNKSAQRLLFLFYFQPSNWKSMDKLELMNHYIDRQRSMKKRI